MALGRDGRKGKCEMLFDDVMMSVLLGNVVPKMAAKDFPQQEV